MVDSFRREKQKKMVLDFCELLFWIYLFYSLFSVHFGISFPYAGITLLVALTGVAFLNLNNIKSSRFPLLMIILTALSYLGIQYFMFGVSILNDYARPFLSWLLFALVFAVLFLRSNFLKRLIVLMFLGSLLLWPFILLPQFTTTNVVQARLQGSGIDNPNDLAAWVGFCVLGFWLWGIKVNSGRARWVLFVCAMIAFLMMSQTVSRGSLIAVTAGIFVSFRNIPRSRWLGILFALALLIILFLQIPVMNQSITFYQERLFQETGRFLAWPIVAQMITRRPLEGYGLLSLGQFVYIAGHAIRTPHNGILFMWLTSGFIPSLPFFALWIGAFWKSFELNNPIEYIDPLPLLLYAFLQMMISNLFFMALWNIATFFYLYSISASNMNELALARSR